MLMQAVEERCNSVLQGLLEQAAASSVASGAVVSQASSPFSLVGGSSVVQNLAGAFDISAGTGDQQQQQHQDGWDWWHHSGGGADWSHGGSSWWHDDGWWSHQGETWRQEGSSEKLDTSA